MWKLQGLLASLVLLCFSFKISSSYMHPRFGTSNAAFVPCREKDLARLHLSTEVVDEATSTSTLAFRGELTLNSEPSKALENDKILDFFAKPEHRNLLITAGGSRPAFEVAATNEILEEWKDAASKVGGTLPIGAEGETLLSVQTGAIRFPGLTVTSSAIIGTKLSVLPTKRPLYEFVLIKDEQSVEGIPPMVWIYNQLTGLGNKESKSETSARSLSKVTAEIDDDTKYLTFQIACYLEVYVKIPSLLLRILPVSKEKAEVQGSAAVLKAVEVDATKGITKFREAYDALI